MTEDPFRSPLRRSPIKRIGWIDFGSPEPNPQSDALRRAMHLQVVEIAAVLPAGSADQIKGILTGYSGIEEDIFRAFYAPVWSFLRIASGRSQTILEPLHEQLAATDLPRPPSGEACRIALDANKSESRPTEGTRKSGELGRWNESALRTQACALLLHLWDDHLCDGQLETNMATVEFGSRLRNGFVESAAEMYAEVGLDPQATKDALDEYTEALRPGHEITRLENYIALAKRQFATWAVVPFAIGFAANGERAAADLAEAVLSFAVAWRLLDDIQDVAEDAQTGSKSAVWYAIDETGRELWSRCEGKDPRIDPEPLVRLALYASESEARSRLVEEIRKKLATATSLARQNGWRAYADELEACAAPFF
jgi:hypothetical protein